MKKDNLEIIFLQRESLDESLNEPLWCTWCEDRINDSDIEYIRKDKHEELEGENKEMLAYLVKINICKVCPECFKTLYCDLMNCNEYKKKLLIEKTGKSIEDIINESNT